MAITLLLPVSIKAAETAFATSTVETSRVPDAAWPYLVLVGVILLGLFGTARKLIRNQN